MNPVRFGSNNRLALFVSGRGSTMQSLLELPHLNPVLVVSNKKSAEALVKARRSGVPVFHMHKNISWTDLHMMLQSRRVNQIFLCGFMKIIPAEFVNLWQGRIFNVHPSLLPLFAGAHAIDDSLKQRGPFGVSVHKVTEKMDSGPLFGQVLCSYQLPDSPEKASDSEFQLRLKISRAEQFLLREWAYKISWQSLSEKS